MRFSAPSRFAVGLLFAALPLAACGQDAQLTSTRGAGATGDTASTTGGGGSAGSGPGQPLVVTDWNTHNFFNDKDDSATPTPSDEMVYTTAEYLQKRQEIAAVIKPANPDIVMLAEVEHQSILDDLNQDLGGIYPTRVLYEGNDPRGLDVAVMSKIPFDSTKSHKDDAFQRLDLVGGQTYMYARDCLEVHLTYGGRKIVLLGVHYRSKVAPDDPSKRLAEAQHTRVIADGITKADPQTLVIILGDFNDVPSSPPVNWSLDGGGNGAPVYQDAADAVASADRWTYDFSGSHELIDHQMPSPGLAPMLDPSGVSIPHDSAVTTASDHAPILARYLVK